MLEGVRNCIQHVGIEPAEAFLMATSIPAEVIGMLDRLGTIETGRNANLLWLDKDFNLKKVWFTFTE